MLPVELLFIWLFCSLCCIVRLIGNKMKIPLSIKTTYLPEWGIWEGVREFVQNAKDSDTDGYKMNIYFPSKGILRMENKGVVLSHKILLLGETTKQNRSDQIGRFGEGAKGASLAFVRAGRMVRIRTGNELWVPKIEHSKTFDEKILVFEITKTKEFINDTRVEIGISVEEWESFKKRFLFLSEIDKKDFCGQSLVLDKDYSGKIFVKGIFIQDEPDLKYGYDLCIYTDRDRKMIYNYDLNRGMALIWEDATRLPEHHQEFLNMLINNDRDIKFFEDHAYISKSFENFVKNWWIENYGERAHPVSSEAEIIELSHFGTKGIIIASKPLFFILTHILGDKESIKKSRTHDIIKTYDVSELTESEKDNLKTSIRVIESLLKTKISDLVEVVDFYSDTILGLWCFSKIKISRKQLKSIPKTLSTLIHEVAHYMGSEGDQGHMQFIAATWEELLRRIIIKFNLEDICQ